ncbi:TlpA family protein disulfide reductase [Candidatus Neomarinimicrobiota bacterium]
MKFIRGKSTESFNNMIKHTIRTVLISSAIMLAGCQSKESLTLEISSANSIIQRIESHAGSEAVLVNFWATWCKPCVEEFPIIVNLKEKYSNQELEAYFVSVDFIDNQNAVINFLTQQGVTGLSFIKPDGEDNSFINAINSKWTGAVPFTVLYSKSSGQITHYWEGAADREQFEQAIILAINS